MAKSPSHYDAPAQPASSEDPGIAKIRADREARKASSQARLEAEAQERAKPVPQNVPANQPAGQGTPVSPPPAPEVRGTVIVPPRSGQPANKRAAKRTPKAR